MRHEDDLQDRRLANPIEDGIVLIRDEHGVGTNVPHFVIHHSPTGYEFGYGGSGPADLALNIAELMLRRLSYKGKRMQCYDGYCFELAYTLHQDLKWQFIAGADRDSETIPLAEVQDWVAARLHATPEIYEEEGA